MVPFSAMSGRALSISNIEIIGADAADFSQTNDCVSSLAAGDSCAINVTFSPTASGTSTATLIITDNSSGLTGSAQAVTLSGTGFVPVVNWPGPPVFQPPPVTPEPLPQPAPVKPQPGRAVNPHTPLVSLSSSSLTFSPLIVGASSPQTVTLTNTGDDPLTISGITASGDFSQTNTCGTTLSAGDKCAISVTFKPRAAGTGAGTLSISDDPDGSPETVALSGTGQVSKDDPHPPDLQSQPAKAPPPN